MSWFISPSLLAKTSSAMPMTPGTVLMTSSSLTWKTSELTDRPKGSCSHLSFRKGVFSDVSNELSLSN